MATVFWVRSPDGNRETRLALPQTSWSEILIGRLVFSSHIVLRTGQSEASCEATRTTEELDYRDDLFKQYAPPT